MQLKEGQHTHRNYLILITGILILLGLAIYKLKWSYTLDIWQSMQASEARVETAADSRGRLESLKADLRGLEQRSEDKRTKEELQRSLFDHLNSIGQQYRVSITGMSHADVSMFDNYEVTSFSVEMSGNYIDIVQALNDFESNPDGMRLASVAYQSHLNRQTKQKQLKATIHVQHLRLS